MAGELQSSKFVPFEKAQKLWIVAESLKDLPGRLNPEEYFCETFAAYRFEDGLADKDPQGYDMVEAILRMVWMK
jgi:hypothetical protein